MLEISINKYCDKIGDVIGNILCGGQSNEETTESFADLLIILSSTNIHLIITQALIRGICFTLRRFVDNENTCLKLLQALAKHLTDEESKLNN